MQDTVLRGLVYRRGPAKAKQQVNVVPCIKHDNSGDWGNSREKYKTSDAVGGYFDGEDEEILCIGDGVED